MITPADFPDKIRDQYGYLPVSLLGKGKSGYSWLVNADGKLSVLKLIHHEPVSYYTFTDKFQAELDAYSVLTDAGLPVPSLLAWNREEEWILKTYLEGPTAAQLVAEKSLIPDHWNQIFSLSGLAKSRNINVDFFPTNFVSHQNKLFYIDYEVNPYLPEWNFENWGIWYWVNSAGMAAFLKTGNSLEINSDSESGKPRKNGFESLVAGLLAERKELLD